MKVSSEINARAMEARPRLVTALVFIRQAPWRTLVGMDAAAHRGLIDSGHEAFRQEPSVDALPRAAACAAPDDPRSLMAGLSLLRASWRTE
jgi:hypothetical protein